MPVDAAWMVRLRSNHERRPEHRLDRRAARRSCARGDAHRASRRPGAHGDGARRGGRRDEADGQRASRPPRRRRPARGRGAGAAPLLPPGRRRRRAIARKPDGRRLPHRRAAPSLEPARTGASQGPRVLRPPRGRSRRARVRRVPQATLAGARRSGAGLAPAGERFCRGLGLTLSNDRRPTCRACLDWSARRNHLAGQVGKALLERCYQLQWAKRRSGTRVVEFNARGEREFRELFA